MLCRECKIEIGNSKYCHACGWLNGKVILLTHELELNGSHKSTGIIKMKNEGNGTVSVEVSIENNTGKISFAQGFGQDNGTGRKFYIEGRKEKEIPIVFSLANSGESMNGMNLKICFTTDDNSPSVRRENCYPRPYKVAQERKWHEWISVKLLEPGALEFDKQMLVFDDERKQRILNAKNIGQQDVSLNHGCFSMDDNFSVLIDKAINIAPGESVPITIEMSRPVQNPYNIMNVAYETEGENKPHSIVLYRRNVIDETPTLLCDKVVAVDFGTSKTAAAYMDVNLLSGAEQFSQATNMITLDAKKKSYDVPSCIVYTLNDIIVGRPDAGEDLISSMKMYLHQGYIETNVQGKTKRRMTQEVITSFLAEIKRRIDAEITEDDNIYVFTLPVLDNDSNGDMFTKQKEVTISCAQAAGFDGEILTITEPEAAMFYIINAIKDNPDNLNGCELQSGDKICVFDYGGGTLDICFGTYNLCDGKPTVKNTVSIGTYRTGNADDDMINLGGDRLDNQMALCVCYQHRDAIELEGAVLDESGNLKSADFFTGDDKPFSTWSWRTYINQIKNRKEELSKQWDSSTDSLPIDKKHESVALTRKTFEETVFADLQYAINEMRNIIEEKELSDLKYIFMVGGTSLIKIIKEHLKIAFPRCKRIFNAYDFSIKDSDRDTNLEEIRQIAVYPVVRGAAISYMTIVTDIFDFDVTIAPVICQDERSKIKYSKGERFYGKTRNLSGKSGMGKWEIFASIEGKEPLNMGIFSIETLDDATPFSVKIRSEVGKDRALKIYYKLHGDESENAVQNLEVYV